MSGTVKMIEEFITEHGVLIIIGIFLFSLRHMTSKPKNFPPGPPIWPVFGNLRSLLDERNLNDLISYMQERYGDVIGLYIFNRPMIFITGIEGIREAMLRDDFSGRPENVHQKQLFGQVQGIIYSTGEEWKMQRRFVLQHLRELAFTKSTIEGIVNQEMQAVFDILEEATGGHQKGYPYPVNFHEVLRGANINVLWHMVAGKRYDYRDNKFKQLENIVLHLSNRYNQGSTIYHTFSLLAKIFPNLSGFTAYKSNINLLHDFIQEEIISHKQIIDYSNPKDFMDTYLREIERQKVDMNDVFNEMQLKQLCSEFFVAGIDTTANNLSFAMLYMILYPEKQKKIQKELDEVVGKDRLPSLNDITRLPYVEAAIQEVLRLSSVASVTVAHAPFTTQKNITFKGYHIPKDSSVFLHLHGLHHDPRLWKYPKTFIPERFLQDDGNHKVIYPFGGGRRGCIGESLARNNIFLFLTAILQRYSLKVPEGHRQPSQEPDGMAILYPKPFSIQLQLRS